MRKQQQTLLLVWKFRGLVARTEFTELNPPPLRLPIPNFRRRN